MVSLIREFQLIDRRDWYKLDRGKHDLQTSAVPIYLNQNLTLDIDREKSLGARPSLCLMGHTPRDRDPDSYICAR